MGETMAAKKGTSQSSKTEPVVKRPFTRSRSIDSLLGEPAPTESPGELGQAFLHAASVKGKAQEPESQPDSSATLDTSPAAEQSATPSNTANTESHSGLNSLGTKLPVAWIVQNKVLQPRLQIDEEHVIRLANDFQKSEQHSAILVRPIDNAGEGDAPKYEIIAGNHRFLAIKRLGWTHIIARILNVSFEEARIISASEMDSTLPTSGYEKAVAYQALLDDKIVKSYVDLAERYDVSKAAISQLMTFIKLPERVRTILNDHPALFTYRTAADLHSLIERHKDESGDISDETLDIVAQGVERLIDGKPVSGLINWIEQNISGKPLFTPQVPPGIVLDAEKRTAFKTKRKDRSITVEWAKTAIFTAQEVEAALLNALTELAEKHEE